MAGEYFDVDKTPPPRSMAVAEPGYGAVPEYQVSSLPWVTSSTATAATTIGFTLPKVASFIQLLNNGSPGQFIRLGFTKNGVENANYIRVDGSSSIKLDLRVRDVFVRSDAGASPSFSLIAGLTMIPSRFAPVLTGSVSSSQGYWEGVG